MIKTILTRSLLAISLLTISFSASSQSGDTWPGKSVSLTAGFTSIAGYHTAPLGVEFMWHRAKVHHGISAGLTAVIWDSYSWSRFGPGASYTFMTGTRANHLEITIGAAMAIVDLFGEDRAEDGRSNDFASYGQIGYRYQKPGGRSFFRVNLGSTGLGFGAGIRIGGR